MAVNLSPVGGAAAQFFDNSGQVLTGGKLYTYAAGTTTPAPTYTTSSGVTAQPNPIVFNAAGRVPDSGEIWLTDSILYKFVLKDANDVLIATYDNLVGINSNFINFTGEEETQTATQGQTVFTLANIQYQPGANNLLVFVNGSKQIVIDNYNETSSTVVTFVDGLNVGDVVDFSTAVPINTLVAEAGSVAYVPPFTNSVPTNVEAKLAQTISVEDFGCDLAVAVASLSPLVPVTLIVNCTVVGDGVTIPANMALVVEQNGLITLSVGAVFTVNGTFSSGSHKCFSLPLNGTNNLFTADVVFAAGSVASVTPSWFTNNGNTGVLDTAGVNAAFASGQTVIFTDSYYVDNVVIDGLNQTINFNGFALEGVSNYGAAYILAIIGSYLRLFDVQINSNFNSYGCAVRWYSDATHTAQFIKIFGLNISNATNGLVYGNFVSVPSYSAAQSENTIYSFTTRAVQVPFTGNQTNGFLTLVAPILDCAPSEWTSQPGYNTTTWNTAAYALINLEGALVILGGELLKTTSQLGFGCNIKNVYMDGVTFEIAATQANILGNVTINNNLNGYFSNDTSPLFVFDSGATGAELKIVDGIFLRPDGTGIYSGAAIFSGTPTGACVVNIRNTLFRNWAASALLAAGASNISIQSQQTIFNNYTAGGALSTSTTPADYVVARGTAAAVASAGTITAVDPIFHVSGTVTIAQINLPYVGFTGSITIIPDGVFALVTSGGNIGKATNSVVGKALILTYDGSKWWPSY